MRRTLRTGRMARSIEERNVVRVWVGGFESQQVFIEMKDGSTVTEDARDLTRGAQRWVLQQLKRN